MVRNLRGDVERESLMTSVEDGSNSRSVETLSGTAKELWTVAVDLKLFCEPSKGINSFWGSRCSVPAADARPRCVERVSLVTTVGILAWDCLGFLVERAEAMLEVSRELCCPGNTSRYMAGQSHGRCKPSKHGCKILSCLCCNLRLAARTNIVSD